MFLVISNSGLCECSSLGRACGEFWTSVRSGLQRLQSGGEVLLFLWSGGGEYRWERRTNIISDLLSTLSTLQLTAPGTSSGALSPPSAVERGSGGAWSSPVITAPGTVPALARRTSTVTLSSLRHPPTPSLLTAAPHSIPQLTGLMLTRTVPLVSRFYKQIFQIL